MRYLQSPLVETLPALSAQAIKGFVNNALFTFSTSMVDQTVGRLGKNEKERT